MQARNIDEVILLLDGIIEQSRRDHAPAGLFAALYRQVTLRVKAHIAEGRFFDDNERMARFDTVFANRYFAAFHAWQRSEPVTEVWKLAFERAKEGNGMLIQHLLLGVNAHINLDLGIAAAEVCAERGEPIDSLEADFERINDILMALLEDAQAILNQYSPTMLLVDIVGTKFDELLGILSLRQMRTIAWDLARLLHELEPEARVGAIRLADAQAAFFGRYLAEPPILGGMLRFGVRFERAPMGQIITDLDRVATGQVGRRRFRRVRQLISSMAFWAAEMLETPAEAHEQSALPAAAPMPGKVRVAEPKRRRPIIRIAPPRTAARHEQSTVSVKPADAPSYPAS